MNILYLKDCKLKQLLIFVISWANHQKYNGKELIRMHGLDWYDYGARYYDAVISQFTTIDPLAEKYYSISPYAYCAGNPVMFVDPDGRFLESVWDIASLITGVVSFKSNIQQGNFSDAVVDGIGIVADGIALALPGIPGGIGAGIKVARGADKAVDGVRSVGKGYDGLDAMKHRVKLRVKTKQDIKNSAPKTLDGRFIDPNTGIPIEKGQEVFGHRSGKEWKSYKKAPENPNKTRKEVIVDQNDPSIYQIEDKKSNSSHKFEKK